RAPGGADRATDLATIDAGREAAGLRSEDGGSRGDVGRVRGARARFQRLPGLRDAGDSPLRRGRRIPAGRAHNGLVADLPARAASPVGTAGPAETAGAWANGFRCDGLGTPRD